MNQYLNIQNNGCVSETSYMLVPVDEGLIGHSKPFELYPEDSGKP